MSCPQCCSQFISWLSNGIRTRARRQQPSSARSVQTGILCGLPADVSLPITTQSTTPSKKNSKSTTAANQSRSRSKAWSVITAVLLIPPWISRAVTIISARRNSNDDVEEDQVTDDNGEDGMLARELLEIVVMALLQDLTVAAFATCLVVLPGLTSIRRIMGTSAKEGKHRSRQHHHRSRHHNHHNKTSAALSFLLAGTVFVLFILPIWMDMEIGRASCRERC